MIPGGFTSTPGSLGATPGSGFVPLLTMTGDPSDLCLTGQYVPLIELAGSYVNTISLQGAYQPEIVITGRKDDC